MYIIRKLNYFCSQSSIYINDTIFASKYIPNSITYDPYETNN